MVDALVTVIAYAFGITAFVLVVFVQIAIWSFPAWITAIGIWFVWRFLQAYERRH
jgi:hypothetical protein